MQSLNCRGRLLTLDSPRIMGILNLTPDSFSDGGKYNAPDTALAYVEQMLADGADMIDVGAYSSRPGAEDISPEEELRRLEGILPQLLQAFPEALFSLDTFRPQVASAMLDLGIHLVNDISGNVALAALAAAQQAPYILMHMQGTPQTMQENPSYEAITEEVYAFFVDKLREIDPVDVVLDPGFGFGKTAAHNYQLFQDLAQFHTLARPLLVGISRKRMLSKGLGLPATTVAPLAAALHYQALCKGAHMLRVHDVAAAHAIRTLYLQYGAL